MWPGIKYFEAHITLDWPLPREGMTRWEIVELANRRHFHWSNIEGDEVMGRGVHAYLTRSDKDIQKLKDDITALCEDLVAGGTPWLRRKIEGIIVDERPEALGVPVIGRNGVKDIADDPEGFAKALRERP